MSEDLSRSYETGAVEDDVTPTSAAVANDGAGGLIGYGNLDSDTSDTGTTANAIVVHNVPVNGSRLIVVSADFSMVATGPTSLQMILFIDSTQLKVKETSTYAGGVRIGGAIKTLVRSPDPGNHNFTLAFGISGSGETVHINGSDCLAELFVNDDGADSLA